MSAKSALRLSLYLLAVLTVGCVVYWGCDNPPTSPGETVSADNAMTSPSAAAVGQIWKPENLVQPFMGIRVDGTDARPLNDSPEDTPWGYFDASYNLHWPYATREDAQNAADAMKRALRME